MYDRHYVGNQVAHKDPVSRQQACKTATNQQRLDWYIYAEAFNVLCSNVIQIRSFHFVYKHIYSPTSFNKATFFSFIVLMLASWATVHIMHMLFLFQTSGGKLTAPH